MNAPRIIQVHPVHLTFDLETRALPEDELLARFNPKFEAKRTLVDPNKIKADILEKRATWFEECTLHAERSQILALGFTTDGGETIECLHGEDEARDVLCPFITEIERHVLLEVSGFNILDFDLPFFRRRCLINRIPFPYYDPANKWKPWTFRTFDAMIDWQSGNRQERISLDTLARALGIEGKSGDWREFVPMYEKDPETALPYLRQDVRTTAKVVEAMKS